MTTSTCTSVTGWKNSSSTKDYRWLQSQTSTLVVVRHVELPLPNISAAKVLTSRCFVHYNFLIIWILTGQCHCKCTVLFSWISYVAGCKCESHVDAVRFHQQSWKQYSALTRQLLMPAWLEFPMLMAGKSLERTCHWNMAPLQRRLNLSSLSQVTSLALSLLFSLFLCLCCQVVLVRVVFIACCV